MHDPHRQARIQAVQNAQEFAKEHGGGRLLTIPWDGGQINIPVIKMDLDVVVLNPHSRRVVSYLEDHPDRGVFASDPFGTDAQDILTDLLKRNPLGGTEVDPAYLRLKEDLRRHGQLEPGVITHDGILFNANTRAVALRELGEKKILVAVLPSTATPPQLGDLELMLQLRPKFEREYSYTSYLLSVDELMSVHKLSVKQVAERIGRPEKDIEAARRILTMVRDLQKLGEVVEPDGKTHRIPLTYFNDKQQSLEEIDRTLQSKAKAKIPDHAKQVLRETRLLAMLVGATKLELREIDESHLSDHLAKHLPQELADHVTAPEPSAPVSIPGLQTPLTLPTTAMAVATPLLERVARARTIVATVDPLHEQHAPAGQLLSALKVPIGDASEAARAARRKDERLDSPAKKVSEAATRLSDAAAVLDEVLATDGFDRETLRDAVTEARAALERIDAALAAADAADAEDPAQP